MRYRISLFIANTVITVLFIMTPGKILLKFLLLFYYYYYYYGCH